MYMVGLEVFVKGTYYELKRGEWRGDERGSAGEDLLGMLLVAISGREGNYLLSHHRFARFLRLVYQSPRPKVVSHSHSYFGIAS